MQIINHCSDAPAGLERRVRQAVRWIEASHLEGLSSIQLEAEMPKSAVAEHEVKWARRVRLEDRTAHAKGWYASPATNAPAFVMLYVQPIYRGMPRALWWSPLPTLRIIRTLAHEVAHHLKVSRGFILHEGENDIDEEALADRYAESVLERVTKKWPYKLGQLCLRELASWHYTYGMLDWREKKYLSAMERFYKAWDLNPENKEAGYWYWRAKDNLVGSGVVLQK